MRMTFERLRKILVKENIRPYDYDILDTGYVSGYDGYVITKGSRGYDLFYMERGVKDLLSQFDNEHDVCIAFLREFIRDGETKLEKYIEQSQQDTDRETGIMNFNDVRKILIKRGIDEECCSVLDHKWPKGKKGTVVFWEDDVYKVYDVDGNIRLNIEKYTDEQEASRAFLKRLNERLGEARTVEQFSKRTRRDGGKMTFDDVRKILKEIDFNMDCCSILDQKTVRAGDGVVIFYEDGVYKVFNVERQVPFDIEEYATEHDACMAFLKKLEESFGPWYDFSKYV